MRRLPLVVLSLASVFAATGCRTAYYSVWENLGKEKRELLVDRIQDVQSEQKQAAEEFQDALTRLQEAYGRKGTALEKAYDRLKSEHEDASEHSTALKDRIKRVDTVANDLFREWDDEIDTLSKEDFKRKSRAQLKETQAKYADLARSLRASEKRMDSVLGELNDYVLFLKHNLNAQALGTLEDETRDIEQDIKSLINEMNASIKDAQEFVAHMRQQGSA